MGRKLFSFMVMFTVILGIVGMAGAEGNSNKVVATFEKGEDSNHLVLTFNNLRVYNPRTMEKVVSFSSDLFSDVEQGGEKDSQEKQNNNEISTKLVANQTQIQIQEKNTMVVSQAQTKVENKSVVVSHIQSKVDNKESGSIQQTQLTNKIIWGEKELLKEVKVEKMMEPQTKQILISKEAYEQICNNPKVKKVVLNVTLKSGLIIYMEYNCETKSFTEVSRDYHPTQSFSDII